MKTWWKIGIAIFLFFLLDAIAVYLLYTKPWIKLAPKHGESAKVVQPTPTISPIKVFSSTDMHLSFNYPKKLLLTEVNPHLISLQNPTNPAADKRLYIFETSVIHNAKIVDVPFIIKAKIKKQVAIPVPNFTAKQITYSDGVIYLTLQKDQQFIMVRIPKDSQYVADAITDLVGTIRTLP